LAFTVTGCYSSKTHVSSREAINTPADSAGVPDYYDVLSKWSRSDKLFKRLDARLHINATLKSVEFRRAYAEEYAHRYRFDDDKLAVLLKNELASHKAYNEFFISTYTPRDSWNDFAEKDSIWQLYLVDGEGRRAEPAEIEELDSSDVLLNEFFPYIDPWSKVYLVRFPRYDTSGTIPIGDRESAKLTLVIVGIKAKGALIWDLMSLDGDAPVEAEATLTDTDADD
jgi:hypothetical protein